MDNFEEIIKQKAEQFEVPFNDAHWAEMDGKLNAIRAAKIKNTILGSAAAIAIVAASSFFIFSNNENTLTTEDNSLAEINTPEAHIANTPEAHIAKEEVNNSKNSITVSEENSIENENTATVNPETNTIVPEKNTLKKEIEQSTSAEKATPNSFQKVNAEFIVYNNNVCLGEEVSFEASENEQPVSYLWDFGDGTTSTDANPTHLYNNSNTYTVSLTLINRRTGQEFTSVQENVVNILAKPQTNFSYIETSLKHDDNKLMYPYTTFNVTNKNKAYSYKWNYGNKEVSSSANGKTMYKRKGDYTATLTVQNTSTGCSQVLSKKVVIKNGQDLYAPNAFTPNDNGGNETFIPKALLGWDVQFEMIIINKSGKTIYKTSDKSEPWNGKINNTGQVLDEGIYLWQVITYDAEGTSHRQQGKIHLVK